jgi:hypothetical protein
MDRISKALGAGLGGGVVGTAGLPFMPEGTPWYGYLALYAVTVLVPMLGAFVAPRNAD